MNGRVGTLIFVLSIFALLISLWHEYEKKKKRTPSLLESVGFILYLSIRYQFCRLGEYLTHKQSNFIARVEREFPDPGGGP